MMQLLDRVKGEYKVVYDELIQFEQDNCTMDVARALAVAGLQIDGSSEAEQKGSVEGAFREVCAKKACSIHYVMSPRKAWVT